jgi:hypothetical protein
MSHFGDWTENVVMLGFVVSFGGLSAGPQLY